MRRNTASADDLAPLLFELARALRARRAHPPEHPVVAEALGRVAAAWRAAARAGEAELALRDGGLERGDGRPLEGPGALELASELRARGIAIVWIEHIVHVLVRVVERLVCMDAGRVIADGAPEAVMRDAAVIDAYLGSGA